MDKQSLMQRNNLIRAGVMGANDGILSVSGIVLGVAGATSNTGTILLAGFAGMLAGTVSMAMGNMSQLVRSMMPRKKFGVYRPKH